MVFTRLTITGLILVCLLMSSPFLLTAAQADGEYCRLENNATGVYLMVRNNATKEEIRQYQRALGKIYDAVDEGDELSLYGATEKGIIRLYGGCKPGCPKGGVFKEFLGLGDCDPTRAKAKRLVFMKSFQRSAMQQFDTNQNGVNDVLKSLSGVHTHIENSSRNEKAWIISSMSNEPNIELGKLNAWFIEIIQTDAIPSIFPDATVSGLAINADLVGFWNDLYSLRGQEFTYR